MRGGEKRLDCCGRLIWRDPWQYDLPFRGLKPWRRCGSQVCDLDHIDPVWQGRVQAIPDSGRV
jgi:hypothetical protein